MNDDKTAELQRDAWRARAEAAEAEVRVLSDAYPDAIWAQDPTFNGLKAHITKLEDALRKVVERCDAACITMEGCNAADIAREALEGKNNDANG